MGMRLLQAHSGRLGCAVQQSESDTKRPLATVDASFGYRPGKDMNSQLMLMTFAVACDRSALCVNGFYSLSPAAESKKENRENYNTKNRWLPVTAHNLLTMGKKRT